VRTTVTVNARQAIDILYTYTAEILKVDEGVAKSEFVNG
jgi:hypothetical protein